MPTHARIPPEFHPAIQTSGHHLGPHAHRTAIPPDPPRHRSGPRPRTASRLPGPASRRLLRLPARRLPAHAPCNFSDHGTGQHPEQRASAPTRTACAAVRPLPLPSPAMGALTVLRAATDPKRPRRGGLRPAWIPAEQRLSEGRAIERSSGRAVSPTTRRSSAGCGIAPKNRQRFRSPRGEWTDTRAPGTEPNSDPGAPSWRFAAAG